MIITTYTLVCTHCGRTEEYTDSYPLNKPENWYSLQPNYKHSEWRTTDFSIGGMLCSLECILAYVQEAIKEEDSRPIDKPFFETSSFSPAPTDSD